MWWVLKDKQTQERALDLLSHRSSSLDSWFNSFNSTHFHIRFILNPLHRSSIHDLVYSTKDQLLKLSMSPLPTSLAHRSPGSSILITPTYSWFYLPSTSTSILIGNPVSKKQYSARTIGSFKSWCFTAFPGKKFAQVNETWCKILTPCLEEIPRLFVFQRSDKSHITDSWKSFYDISHWNKQDL